MTPCLCLSRVPILWPQLLGPLCCCECWGAWRLRPRRRRGGRIWRPSSRGWVLVCGVWVPGGTTGMLKGTQQAPRAVGLYALPVPMCLEDAQERDMELGCLVSCDCRTLSVEASGASLTSPKYTSSFPAHCHHLLWAFPCLAGHCSPVMQPSPRHSYLMARVGSAV